MIHTNTAKNPEYPWKQRPKRHFFLDTEITRTVAHFLNINKIVRDCCNQSELKSSTVYRVYAPDYVCSLSLVSSFSDWEAPDPAKCRGHVNWCFGLMQQLINMTEVDISTTYSKPSNCRKSEMNVVVRCVNFYIFVILMSWYDVDKM